VDENYNGVGYFTLTRTNDYIRFYSEYFIIAMGGILDDKYVINKDNYLNMYGVIAKILFMKLALVINLYTREMCFAKGLKSIH
jgi:hypothetical protein